MTSILHISHLEAPNKFLGLPADIPRSKHQIFFFIKVRVANKIAGWKEQLLSKSGKEVLIKSVLLAIPIYVMSYSQLPLSLCRDLNMQISNF